MIFTFLSSMTLIFDYLTSKYSTSYMWW